MTEQTREGFLEEVVLGLTVTLNQEKDSGGRRKRCKLLE